MYRKQNQILLILAIVYPPKNIYFIFLKIIFFSLCANYLNMHLTCFSLLTSYVIYFILFFLFDFFLFFFFFFSYNCNDYVVNDTSEGNIGRLREVMIRLGNKSPSSWTTCDMNSEPATNQTRHNLRPRKRKRYAGERYN